MHPLVTQDHIDAFQRDGVVLIKGCSKTTLIRFAMALHVI